MLLFQSTAGGVVWLLAGIAGISIILSIILFVIVINMVKSSQKTQNNVTAFGKDMYNVLTNIQKNIEDAKKELKEDIRDVRNRLD